MFQYSHCSPRERHPSHCHLDRSVAQRRDLRSSGPLLECSVQLLLSPEAPPFPLSSRPERSAAERSLCGCSLSHGVFQSSNCSSRKRHPPLCHLDRSAAQRRDLCVDALAHGVFQSSNCSSRKGHSSLCHLDRSVAQWTDLCVDALSWECFSTE